MYSSLKKSCYNLKLFYNDKSASVIIRNIENALNEKVNAGVKLITLKEQIDEDHSIEISKEEMLKLGITIKRTNSANGEFENQYESSEDSINNDINEIPEELVKNCYVIRSPIASEINPNAFCISPKAAADNSKRYSSKLGSNERLKKYEG